MAWARQKGEAGYVAQALRPKVVTAGRNVLNTYCAQGKTAQLLLRSWYFVTFTSAKACRARTGKNSLTANFGGSARTGVNGQIF